MSIRRVTGMLLAILLLAQIPAGAAESEKAYRTEHFAITYSTTPGGPATPPLRDRDQDGFADVVQKMADAFEFARSYEVERLGYAAPPVEGRYRLHVGSTARRGYTQTLPGETASRGSFILVPLRLLERDTSRPRMRLFAVHEYFHAIQKGYDVFEDRWLREASASWIQDVAVDRANSNHYLLADFVPYPELPLVTTNDRHEYGAFLFLQFLTERYGAAGEPEIGLVKELWELVAPSDGGADLDSLEALEVLLRPRGSSLTEAWGEFLVWRWRLGRFAEGAAYRTALEALWPRATTVAEVDGESCRIEPGSSPQGLLPLSGDYGRFVPSATSSARATLTLVGSPATTAWTIVRGIDGSVTEAPVTIDATGVGRALIPFGASIRDVAIAVGNGGADGPAAPAYSLIAEGKSDVVASTPRGPDTFVTGEGALLSGSVICAGRPASEARVVLTETNVATGQARETSLVTNGAGLWQTIIMPERNTDYSVRVEDPLLTAAASPTKRVSVLLEVSLEAMPYRPAAGEAVTLTGDVTPNHGALPLVVEFRRPDQEWRLGPQLETDRSGAFSTELRFDRSGIWEVRARLLSAGDEDHEPGTSFSVSIDVAD